MDSDNSSNLSDHGCVSPMTDPTKCECINQAQCPKHDRAGPLRTTAQKIAKEFCEHPHRTNNCGLENAIASALRAARKEGMEQCLEIAKQWGPSEGEVVRVITEAIRKKAG